MAPEFPKDDSSGENKRCLYSQIKGENLYMGKTSYEGRCDQLSHASADMMCSANISRYEY